jgi:hypothetical protein
VAGIGTVAVLFLCVMLAMMGCNRTEPSDEKINKATAERIVNGMTRQEVETLIGTGDAMPHDDPLIAKTLGKEAAQDASFKWVVWTRRPDSRKEVYILVAFGPDGKVVRHHFQEVTTIR